MCFSDHCAIYRIRKLHRVKTSQLRVVVVRNYKNFDANLFKSDLSHVPWDILELDQTPNEAWEDLFLTIADKHAPIITHRSLANT